MWRLCCPYLFLIFPSFDASWLWHFLDIFTYFFLISAKLSCILACFIYFFNSFPASGDSSCLLINFANSLNPDQARQKVGPYLDPNCLTIWWYSWKIFLKKLIFKKKINRRQKHAKLLSMQRVNMEPKLHNNWVPSLGSKMPAHRKSNFESFNLLRRYTTNPESCYFKCFETSDKNWAPKIS